MSNVRELWRYRDAMRAFASLNLRLRYSNTALGFLWSLANPLFLTTVFTFVFTVLTPSGITNFAIFALSALLPWNFFQTALLACIVSVTNGRDLIQKLPFPREILPISYVLSELLNFILALSAVIVIFSAFGQFPGLPLIALPFLIVILVMFTTGVGLLLATINVRLRDTQEFMTVFLFGWFFLTPIVYPLTSIPEDRMIIGVSLRTIVQVVNPMSAIVTGFRAVIYDHNWPSLIPTAIVSVISLILFVLGYVVFKRSSVGFAEAI